MENVNKNTELNSTDKKLIIFDVAESLMEVMKVNILNDNNKIKVESVLPYRKRTQEELDKIKETWDKLPKCKNFH